ncbi:plasmid stabilization system protein [Rodentibacter ratti]|uniref:Plasmid stabilization system protein n=1 Tax=Rodentibacter ratti TaxID=1906745 RepID=A0A1V3LBX3_9PAST|nr:type II toxin-antitoxin system RelE/ParE family toxin [Rodentibacter ratti]OOF86866.1 plasmid stabilization system protein [Rodentibacter ratti]
MIISSEALNDIEECVQQAIIYTGFEMTGIRLHEKIFDKIESIGFMPKAIGRLREDGSREAFIRGYRIVYEEKDDHILIVAIIHSSRLYPRPELEQMP